MRHWIAVLVIVLLCGCDDKAPTTTRLGEKSSSRHRTAANPAGSTAKPAASPQDGQARAAARDYRPDDGRDESQKPQPPKSLPGRVCLICLSVAAVVLLIWLARDGYGLRRVCWSYILLAAASLGRVED